MIWLSIYKLKKILEVYLYFTDIFSKVNFCQTNAFLNCYLNCLAVVKRTGNGLQKRKGVKPEKDRIIPLEE